MQAAASLLQAKFYKITRNCSFLTSPWWLTLSAPF